MIVSALKIEKSYGSNLVLEPCDFKIEDRDRIGLVGVNGAGKSTLLNLLTGREEPDAGELFVTGGAKIGFLRQNSGLNTQNTIWAEMQSVFSKLLEVQKRLRTIEEQLSHTDSITEKERFDELTKEYAVQSEWFEKHDGYLIDVKIKTILGGMGFSDKPYETNISTLSGGEKTRLAMAKLLLEEPDLLVLDEPTNHLDFKTLGWLEAYLAGYKGALLVVSHDRYFLDQLVTTIWEIERNKLFSYSGNYTKFVQLKAEAKIRYQKEYEQQQKQIASMEDYVARNLARASTAKSAKSRIAALERMDVLERPKGDLKTARLAFEYDREPVKDVLDVMGLSLEVGEGERKKTLCKHIDLHVFRGEKIAIIGANGVGKSTFLKAIQGLHPHKGSVEWGRNTAVAYYDQENRGLHPEKTALDELWDRYPRMLEQQVRSALGAVLITGEEVYKQVSVLSGGERAKLCFAMLMLKRGNILLMDEPTNHLDLVSKEILEQALMDFTGTLLMVSHDRYMLNKIPDKIIEFTGDSLRVYKGRYSDYLEQTELERKEEAAVQAAVPKPQTAAPAGGYRSREQKNQEVQRKQRLRELESTIAELEERQRLLEHELTREEVFSDYKLMAEKCSELEQCKLELTHQTDEWVELQAEE